MELSENLKNKIKLMVKQIAVNEHSDVNKHTLKDMPGRLTMACPYCGDSHDDLHKKRGNLYWTTLQYHCFNCGIHSDIYKLFKDYHMNFSDKMDSISIIEYIKTHKVKINAANILQYGIFKKISSIAIARDDLKNKMEFTDIKPGDFIWFYLKRRLLHNNLEKFLYSRKDNRLVILNTTSCGKIIGFQTRSVYKNKKNRYLTYDIERMYEEIDEIIYAPPDEISRMKKMSTLFGVMTVNFQHDVTIFEGPIDAMFMHNTIGLASVGRSTDELDEIPTVRYMFDNDEPGRVKMMEKLRKGKRVFMWSKFMKETNMNIYSNKVKDLNDLVIVSWLNKINCLTKVNNYFTNSQLDVYYI